MVTHANPGRLMSLKPDGSCDVTDVVVSKGFNKNFNASLCGYIQVSLPQVQTWSQMTAYYRGFAEDVICRVIAELSALV